MNRRDYISAELNELNSSLAGFSPVTPYTVPPAFFLSFPDKMLELAQSQVQVELTQESIGLPVTNLPMTVPEGYFENFPGLMLGLAKSGESDAAREIESLSPILSGLRHKSTYVVPADYFEQSIDSVQSAAAEIAGLSPLLAGLDKSMPYKVPQGYFENLTLPTAKRTATVVKMGARKWFRYAAAAVITGLIATMSVVFINSGIEEPGKDGQAWIRKSMKQVSTDELNEFVALTEEPVAEVKPENAREMQALMQDVSDQEIQSFLADAQGTTPEDDDELIFN